jgi:glucose-6-phosphate 1-dehydrogenase
MPVILIIFGATGDLAKRKLLPAIDALKKAGKLPQMFEVVGVSRKPGTDYFQMDVENAAEYVRLAEHLEKIEEKFGEDTQKLFYLSVPPSAVASIVAHLGEAGLLDEPSDKLLLEKPFGTDFASAEAFIAHIAKYAREEQVYRVDHYLAKSLADRILEAKREQDWSSTTVESVEVLATETIGIEGRGGFYEQVGVLGDIIESHLMELLALVLMAPPESPEEVPTERLAALVQLAPVEPKEAMRAQYTGYREEVGNTASVVPTFASVALHSTDPVWAGTVLRLTAGKALSEKRTEVRFKFKNGDSTILNAEPEEFPSGYPQVLLSAIAGEQERFVSSGEVLAAWRVLDTLAQAWRASGDGLLTYERGSSTLQ